MPVPMTADISQVWTLDDAQYKLMNEIQFFLIIFRKTF